MRGLIPAHAGKTTNVRRANRSRPAHPRSRGENEAGDEKGSTFDGSSPLTRGKRLLQVGGGTDGRLIPAHAGKTAPNGIKNFADGAHPRSRGENAIVVGMVREGMGSSPLTRGKLEWRGEDARALRLIPAHAGKTSVHRRCVRHTWAHPRSRGENGRRCIVRDFEAGSSPLTRGKRFLTCAFIAQIGQILESRELCASSESYSLRNVYATDAPPDQVRSIGLVPLSSRGAS